ncbi:MAG: ergothioneine biosynthesis protein EgtB [Burkholderiaceae bacterium]
MSHLIDISAPLLRRPSDGTRSALGRRVLACRQQTEALVEGLSDADCTVQSMDDASPAKWHLAHTTWFFEEVVLSAHLPGYQRFDANYAYLFNSYYESLGPRHPRPRRGMLTRPELSDVLAYRWHVDRALARLLARLDDQLGHRLDDRRGGRFDEQRGHSRGLRRDADETAAAAAALIELGLQHEQQHQELLLTDLLHLFAQNPLRPVYRRPAWAPSEPRAEPEPMRFVAFDAQRIAVGHEGDGFAFDCEGPRHEVLLAPFALADRPVSNREWLHFIDDGGYRSATLWLSDGWQRVCAEGWGAPLYWEQRDGQWLTMTLHGEQPVDPDAPVCHLSYFEADAFARWAGRRLPTEFEWEHAAEYQLRAALGDRTCPGANGHAGVAGLTGHFADSQRYQPEAARLGGSGPLWQLFGDVWEWTSSAFSPYPRFRPASGAIGEYNGKFMCGQFVLRGGSCATPRDHIRPTYRNFFPPHARWQFSGLRLAEDNQ